MSGAAPLSQAVRDLRAAFDEGFAKAPPGAAAPHRNMLAIRIGDQAHALHLDQIGGLYADRAITPLPSPVAALLGVSSFRGQITPVYDLAVLLGHPPATVPRWMVLVRGAHALALAFDQFESHFSAAPAQFTGAAPDQARAHLRDLVHGDGALRPILDLDSIYRAIAGMASPTPQPRSNKS
jgi:chemotaxis signal transduction protein